MVMVQCSGRPPSHFDYDREILIDCNEYVMHIFWP